MKTKIKWIVGFLAFVILLIAATITNKWYYAGIIDLDVKFYFSPLLRVFIWVIVSAGLITLLIILITIRKKRVGERILSIFPIVISIVSIIFLIPFAYLFYIDKIVNIPLSPKMIYSEVKIPKCLDCSKIHTGYFDSGGQLIELNDSLAIMTSKASKEKRIYKVNWVSDCECNLTAMDSSNMFNLIKYKIVRIEPNFYDAFTTITNNASKDRVIRIKTKAKVAYK